MKRMTTVRRSAGAAAVIALCAGTYSSVLSAFAEDICANLASGIDNCPTQPCSQALAESGNIACETIAFLTTFVSQVQSTVFGTGRRSSLHMDATYYMAQAAGFTPRQAYQIAAYDQIPDWQNFELLDENGNALVARADCEDEEPTAGAICELVPKALKGFDRNNFSGGGLNYHFMAPQTAHAAPIMPMDGLHPDLADPYSEQFLVHVRRWAFGESSLLCVGGLTTPSARGDHATGETCFNGEREMPSYLGRIPFITETSPLTNLNWETRLHEQLVSIDPPVPASKLPELVGQDVAPLAALGVYVHAVADRISHHLCITASRMAGPRPADAPPIVTLPLAYDVYMLLINLSDPQYLLQQILAAPIVSNPDFQLVFDDAQCDQLAHASRHTFEAGHEQESLQPEHQTVRPGLDAVYGELLAYAQQRGFAPAQAASADYRARLIDGLTATISTPDASDRLAALTAFARDMDFLPLPGYGGLDYAAWSEQAGALGMKPIDTGTDDGGRFGGAWSPAALLALVGFGLLRRIAGRRARS